MGAPEALENLRKARGAHRPRRRAFQPPDDFAEREGGYPWNTQPVMRQHHVAGERVFVDYAGHTVEVVDVSTPE